MILSLGWLSTSGNHEVVQPKFKSPVKQLPEADFLQRGAKSFDGNALLMFVALHLIADQAERVENPKNWINETGGPSENQRSFRSQDAECLSKDGFGLLEMLKHGEHHHVVELPISKRQRRAQIAMNALPPPFGAAFHLIVQASAASDFALRIVQKSHL